MLIPNVYKEDLLLQIIIIITAIVMLIHFYLLPRAYRAQAPCAYITGCGLPDLEATSLAMPCEKRGAFQRFL